MVLEYRLREEDYINYQLYIASQSKVIKRRRMQIRVVVLLLYIGLGVFILVQNRPALGLLFFVFGLLWFFFYPLQDAKRYVKHYQKAIRERLSAEPDKINRVWIEEEEILVEETGVKSRIELEELSEFVELPTILLARLKGGQSLVIPLNRPDMAEEARSMGAQLAQRLDIPYTKRLDWKWK